MLPSLSPSCKSFISLVLCLCLIPFSFMLPSETEWNDTRTWQHVYLISFMGSYKHRRSFPGAADAVSVAGRWTKQRVLCSVPCIQRSTSNISSAVRAPPAPGVSGHPNLCVGNYTSCRSSKTPTTYSRVLVG